jgi:hypothetical protein
VPSSPRGLAQRARECSPVFRAAKVAGGMVHATIARDCHHRRRLRRRRLVSGHAAAVPQRGAIQHARVHAPRTCSECIRFPRPDIKRERNERSRACASRIDSHSRARRRVVLVVCCSRDVHDHADYAESRAPGKIDSQIGATSWSCTRRPLMEIASTRRAMMPRSADVRSVRLQERAAAPREVRRA